MKQFSRLRSRAISVVVSILFSFFSVTGIASRLELTTKAWTVSLVMLLAVYAILFLFLAELFRRGPGTCTAQLPLPGLPATFGLLLLCWLPTYLAFYPGVFGYDGPVQINYLVTHTLSAHHPVFHTWLLGGCFWLGHLLGGYDIGLAIYTALQTLLVAFAGAYVLNWLRCRNVPALVWWFAAFFFAANPVLPLLNMNTTKDVPFSACFVLVFVSLIDLLEQGMTGDRAGVRRLILFAAASFFLCLMRNQGYYLLFAVAVITVLVLRRLRIRVAALTLVLALAGWFCMNPLMSLLGIPKGDAREMLSVPIQQLACVWNQDREGKLTLTAAERQGIEELIAPEYLIQYLPCNTDPVKTGFETEVLKGNLSKYLGLYVRLGLEHPDAYLEAFLDLSSGFWDIGQPGAYRHLMVTNSFPDLLGEEYDIQVDSKWEGYRSYLTLYVSHFADLPLLNILFGNALPAWLMLALLIAVIFRRRWELFCAVMFCAGQWGICLLSPAMLVRYCMPLMLCLPVFVGLLCEAMLRPKAESAR